jgi:hypothetical protein
VADFGGWARCLCLCFFFISAVALPFFLSVYNFGVFSNIVDLCFLSGVSRVRFFLFCFCITVRVFTSHTLSVCFLFLFLFCMFVCVFACVFPPFSYITCFPLFSLCFFYFPVSCFYAGWFSCCCA